MRSWISRCRLSLPTWESVLTALAEWHPSMLSRQIPAWVRASRRRTRIVWFIVLAFVLVVWPGLLGAVAMAQIDTVSDGPPGIAGVGWMNGLPPEETGLPPEDRGLRKK